MPGDADMPVPSIQNFFKNYSDRLLASLNGLDLKNLDILVKALLKARREKRQIFIFGNGGSAATASHMVNDLAKDRSDDDALRFRVISLTDNLPWITATANDFGYERIFENQLKNLLTPGDVVIAISSSGNSPNILRAVAYARERDALTFGIAGFGGGALKDAVSHCINIPSEKGEYGCMEDVTSILGHIISLYIVSLDSQA
jgi:D-sedoheptulose 7-phosphate isomerase